MVDYSLYTNDEEIPGSGIVLKKARARSKGGMLTSDVQPGRSMLPNARAAIDPRQRAAELYAQGEELYNSEPDYSQLQSFAKQRGEQGNAAMLNALAAQFAGESFAPVQSQFLKKAAAAQDPIKMGSGLITAEGQFIKDPEAAQNKKAEFLLQQAKAYETLAQTAETARERMAAQKQAQELQNQLRLMGLQIQQQGLQLRAENAALARGQQAQAANERKEKQMGESTQKLSKQTEDFTGLYASIKQLNDRLTGYAQKGSKVPGIGLGANMTVGGLNISSPFIGEEGRLNRALAQNVLNQIIRADSGQAVSTQEAARQLLAAMNSPQYTEEDFLNAWENNILPRVNESFSNIGAGYSPEVKQRYREQGGKINFDMPFSNPRGGSSSPGGLAVGAVKDGYRFKGGNPADKNNWEKVQ